MIVILNKLIKILNKHFEKQIFLNKIKFLFIFLLMKLIEKQKALFQNAPLLNVNKFELTVLISSSISRSARHSGKVLAVV